MSLWPATETSSGQRRPGRLQRGVAAERDHVVAGDDRGHVRRASRSSCGRGALAGFDRERLAVHRPGLPAPSASGTRPGAAPSSTALSGPVTCAIRSWPSSARCATTARTPAASSAATSGSVPASMPAGHEHGGDVVAAAPQRRRARRRRHDQALAAARAQLFDQRRLALEVVVGVGQQARQARPSTAPPRCRARSAG